MLTGVRFRLVGEDEMPAGYKIQWGQISSRIDKASGVKAQDATLYNKHGKVVARYYAQSDEVVRENEVLIDKISRKIIEKMNREELEELLEELKD